MNVYTKCHKEEWKWKLEYYVIFLRLQEKEA